jgi:hypothetical protein
VQARSGGLDEAECDVNLGEKLGGGDAPGPANEVVSVFEGPSLHRRGRLQMEDVEMDRNSLN